MFAHHVTGHSATPGLALVTVLAWPGLVIITPAPANHSAPQLRARPVRQARAGDESRARASLSFSLQGRAGRGGRATDPPDGSVLDHSELGVCSQVSVCDDIEHQKLQTESGVGRGVLVTPGLEIPSLVTLEAAELCPTCPGWLGWGRHWALSTLRSRPTLKKNTNSNKNHNPRYFCTHPPCHRVHGTFTEMRHRPNPTFTVFLREILSAKQ